MSGADDQNSRDPNVDTFDHLGDREHEMPIAALDGIHEAGPLSELGLQLCTRCRGILSDYRNALHLEGDPPPTGFAIGAHVEISSGDGAWLTTASPNCEARS